MLHGTRAFPHISDVRPDLRQRALFVTSRAACRRSRMLQLLIRWGETTCCSNQPESRGTKRSVKVHSPRKCNTPYPFFFPAYRADLLSGRAGCFKGFWPFLCPSFLDTAPSITFTFTFFSSFTAFFFVSFFGSFFSPFSSFFRNSLQYS